MLGVGKYSVYDITVGDSDSILYFPRPEEDSWKIDVLQLMMEEREQGYLDDTDQALMDHLCENWFYYLTLPGLWNLYQALVG